jgi:hypothetical protein
MPPEHRQDGRAPCPMTFRDGAPAPRATPAIDSCPQPCAELYQRLCARLAVPSGKPATGGRDACDDGAARLLAQTQWLERAVSHERGRGRAGSWLYDPHRLVALRQLRAMALCLAQIRPHETGGKAEPTNANDRREISRRS